MSSDKLVFDVNLDGVAGAVSDLSEMEKVLEENAQAFQKLQDESNSTIKDLRANVERLEKALKDLGNQNNKVIDDLTSKIQKQENALEKFGNININNDSLKQTGEVASRTAEATGQVGTSLLSVSTGLKAIAGNNKSLQTLAQLSENAARSSSVLSTALRLGGAGTKVAGDYTKILGIITKIGVTASTVAPLIPLAFGGAVLAYQGSQYYEAQKQLEKEQELLATAKEYSESLKKVGVDTSVITNNEAKRKEELIKIIGYEKEISELKEKKNLTTDEKKRKKEVEDLLKVETDRMNKLEGAEKTRRQNLDKILKAEIRIQELRERVNSFGSVAFNQGVAKEYRLQADALQKQVDLARKRVTHEEAIKNTVEAEKVFIDRINEGYQRQIEIQKQNASMQEEIANIQRREAIENIDKSVAGRLQAYLDQQEQLDRDYVEALKILEENPGDVRIRDFFESIYPNLKKAEEKISKSSTKIDTIDSSILSRTGPLQSFYDNLRTQTVETPVKAIQEQTKKQDENTDRIVKAMGETTDAVKNMSTTSTYA